LVGSFDLQKPVSDITYNVFGGTLNPAQSLGGDREDFVPQKLRMLNKLLYVWLKALPCESKVPVCSQEVLQYGISLFGFVINNCYVGIGAT